METTLTPLQIKLLEELKWFDAFCSENDLTYFAIGGTLLGALRHKGFIPWDDDIDVGMPRRDFEKLHAFAGGDGRFVIETYKTDNRDFCYPIAKVYDTSTTLIEHKRINVVRGVFIDIFPIDGIGETESEAYRNFKGIERLYHFYVSFVTGVRKGRSKLKNVAVLLSRLIPTSLLNHKSLSIRLNMRCSSIDYYNSRYVGNLLGAYGRKEIVERELFGSPRREMFEDFQISCPERAEDYLTHIYKDWRRLPPKEKQVSHHDFVFYDLNTPYKHSV